MQQQTYPRDRYEIVVVTPAADAFVPSSPQLVAVRDEHAGPGAARNAGIARARGDILAFTDASCLPAPGWLEEGARAVARTRGLDLVGGRIELFARRTDAPSAAESFETLWSLQQEHDIRLRGVASATNLFVPRALMVALGGFNPALAAKGDWDLCHRARASGAGITYCEAALVRQPAIATWTGLWRSKSHLAAGRLQLAMASGESRNQARLAALWDLRPPLKGIARALLRDTPAGRRAQAGLLAAVAVSRVAYLRGWLAAEASQR